MYIHYVDEKVVTFIHF